MTESWKWEGSTLVDQSGKKKAWPHANGGLVIACDHQNTANLIAKAPEQAQKLQEIDLLLSSAIVFSDSNSAALSINKHKLHDLVTSIRETLSGTAYAKK